jgi:hypothetical protein
MPGRKSLPDTLKRSPAKAQRTWIKAHDNALEQYGDGERAHRTAFAALKQDPEVPRRAALPRAQAASARARAAAGPTATAAGRADRGLMRRSLSALLALALLLHPAAAGA